MIVKCQKKIKTGQTFSKINGKVQDIINPKIIIDKEYVVLGIKLMPTKGVYILILDEENKPILTELSGFEAIPQSVPDEWSCETSDDIFQEMPKEWMNDNFLENLQNSETKMALFYQEAELAYQKEDKIIK